MLVTLLNQIQDAMQENVCNTLELREEADKVSEYRLVHPRAFIGWIPPGRDEAACQYLQSQLQQSSIPCLVIGYDKDTDDGTDAKLDLRLTFAVYGPGVQSGERCDPVFDGYTALMNFMDRARAYLLRDSFALNIIRVVSPVESGLYEAQLYPLWFGWMRFQARHTASSNIDAAKYL